MLLSYSSRNAGLENKISRLKNIFLGLGEREEKKAITGMVCMVAHDGFDAKLTRTRQCTDALKHGRIPFQIPLFYSTPILSRTVSGRSQKGKS